MFRYLRHHYQHVSSASIEDAVSEAFSLYLQRAPECIRDDCRKTGRWIGTAARLLLQSECNRHHSLFEPLEDQVNETSFDGGTTFQAEEWRVNVVLQKLTPAIAEALRLRILHDLPPRDIAAMLGCSVEAVKGRLKRGLRELREDFQQ